MAQEQNGLEPTSTADIQRVGEEAPASSPPSSSLETGTSKIKTRKPPPITPNSFRRFFTPRASLSKGRKKASRSRRALEDITLPASNRRPSNHGQDFEPFIDITKDEDSLDTAQSSISSGKRRRSQLPSPDESPPGSSPCKRFRASPPRKGFTIFDDTGDRFGEIIGDGSEEDDFEHGSLRSVQRCQESFLASQILYQGIGGRCGPKLSNSSGICPGISRMLLAPIVVLTFHSDWQNEIRNFYTSAEDLHACKTDDQLPQSTLPFCSASCNSKYELLYNSELMLTPSFQPILL